MFLPRQSATRKLLGIGFLLLAAVLATSACNTWHGAGKDVERTGEKMQGH